MLINLQARLLLLIILFPAIALSNPYDTLELQLFDIQKGESVTLNCTYMHDMKERLSCIVYVTLKKPYFANAWTVRHIVISEDKQNLTIRFGDSKVLHYKVLPRQMINLHWLSAFLSAAQEPVAPALDTSIQVTAFDST